jgi:hypothetical protein
MAMSRLPGVGGHSLTSLVPGSEGGEKEKPAAFGLLHGGGAPEELGPVQSGHGTAEFNPGKLHDIPAMMGPGLELGHGPVVHGGLGPVVNGGHGPALPAEGNLLGTAANLAGGMLGGSPLELAAGLLGNALSETAAGAVANMLEGIFDEAAEARPQSAFLQMMPLMQGSPTMPPMHGLMEQAVTALSQDQTMLSQDQAKINQLETNQDPFASAMDTTTEL